MRAGTGDVVDDSIRRLPAAPLRDLVAWYSGYRQAGLEPATHRGLPSPFLTLIFTLDEPLMVAAHATPRQPPESYVTLLGGLHTSPALITHQGRQSGIQVALSPLAARSLLGIPAGELAFIDLHADEVLGNLAHEIHERICCASSWSGRFDVLDELLTRRLDIDRTPPAQIGNAWRSLLNAGPSASVTSLSNQVGWSSRHLRQQFRAETGLTPKAASRVVRFHRARRLLQRRVAGGERPELADLAVASGYFDQAHLAREFRALAGVPPSRLLADEFRNVQVAAEDLVGD